MRKKLNLLFILILGIIVMLSLVACNTKAQDITKLPDEIHGGVLDDVVETPTDAYLKFAFPNMPSSVFSSIYIDEFDISDVKYTIVLTDGKTTTEVNGGDVSLDMVDEDDRDLLQTVGHHMIHVSTTLANGKVATGSFALHLKDRSAAIHFVTLTFNLRDTQSGQTAWAYFGTSDRSRGIVTVQAEQGTVFSSWDELMRTYRMSLDGKALQELRYTGGTLSATQGFSRGFELTKDMTFTTVWTDDVINVSFDLALPEGASVINGQQDPRPDFATGGSKASQLVARNIGRAIAPSVDELNVFNGHYFAGWYQDDGDGNFDNDKVWNFTHTVGGENIKLYAKWTVRTYSFTFYTMGGVFPDNIKNSTHNDYPIDSDEKAIEYGYKIVQCSSRFGVSDNKLNLMVFSGFTYGTGFRDYVAKVTVRPQTETTPEKAVYMTLPDVFAKLQKGSRDYVAADGLYKDYQCTEPVNTTMIIGDHDGNIDSIGYVKWVFNEPNRDDYKTDAVYNSVRLDRFSGYFADVLFKDGISLKQDGSVRLDKVADEFVNVLKIPATILFDGQERRITEIAPKACSNLKALTELDLSEAVYLETLGEEAFAHCSALRNIIPPTQENIQNVGKRVFCNSIYENNYQENRNGLQFIVINHTLYKYVGPKDVTSIDLSVDFYTEDNCSLTQEEMIVANNRLKEVQVISAGAFDRATKLESITLGDNVEVIKNNAFNSLANFKNIYVSSASQLKDIGELAFDGCPDMLSSASNCYVSASKAIIIGKVYYRFLDRDASSARIPATIEYIASQAFKNCGNIQRIEFVNEGNIKGVGKDVFFNTPWIRQDNGTNVLDGFVTVNGYLAEYYNDKFDYENVNITIPNYVHTLTESAFNSYAHYLKTIQFGTSVTDISNYAFIGASSLQSLIFTEMTANGDVLVNAPLISENSFSNASDKLINNVNVFIRQEVLDLLDRLVGNIAGISDPVTKSWVRFYNANRDHFIVEDINLVWIDPKVIPTNLMRTGKTGNAFYDLYGTDPIFNALVIRSNTGVERRETLDPIANDINFIEVTQDGAYSQYYQEGVLKVVFTFTYHNTTTGCAINPGDQNLFVATISNAIKGNPSFNNSKVYPSNNRYIRADGNTSANDFWIEGFEGQVEGSNLPTFYTSNDSVSVRFGYKDINGDVHYLPASIVDFNTNVEHRASAIFIVNFNNIGEYRIMIDYAVVVSKFVDIVQTTAVSVPLNGTPSAYFGLYDVDLVGQDGLTQSVALNINNFTVLAVDGVPAQHAVTTSLGMHTLTVRYSKGDAAEPIVKDIVYTVVLDADENLFTYEIINERELTARITGCTTAARYADTIVLPSTHVIGDKTYTITEIGRQSGVSAGVFQNFTALKAVYLATTIKKIGVNTFAGCTSLESVFTAQLADAGITEIPYANLVDVRVLSQTADKIVKEVKLNSLVGVVYSQNSDGDYVLAVAPSYTYIVDGVQVICNIVEVADLLEYEHANTDVFMPDTIYNVFAVSSVGGTPYVPTIYPSKSRYMFSTEEYAPDSLTHIGNRAFYGCTALKNIDLTKAVDLKFIDVATFATSGLESIDLSHNLKLTELNNQTFERAQSLVSVTLHSGIVVIGASCFDSCSSLTNINVVGTDLTLRKDTIASTLIDSNAFNQCTALTSVRIAQSVQTINANAFATCNALTIYCEIAQSAKPATWASNCMGECPVVWDCNHNDVADDGLTYAVVDGIRYSFNKANNTATVARQSTLLSEVTIPQTIGVNGKVYTVTEIGAHAFEGNINLVNITLTSSIETINEYAFANCIALLTVNFVDDINGLQSINNTAFNNCASLVNAPSIAY